MRSSLRAFLLVALAAATLPAALAAQPAIGSQAQNIPFSNQWQVPSSPPAINELNDYFTPTASPGYTTLLVLWGIN